MSALHATNRQSIHTDVLNILQVHDLLINEKSGTEQLSLDLLFYVKFLHDQQRGTVLYRTQKMQI